MKRIFLKRNSYFAKTNPINVLVKSTIRVPDTVTAVLLKNQRIMGTV
jgi:hypothetical protein